MSRQSATHVLAGCLILIGLGLGEWVNSWWFLLAVFVGANLFQSGFTGICPAEAIFGKFGLKDAGCFERKGSSR